MKPVKAYKLGKRILLPSELTETKVYVCPYTTEVFQDRKKFGEHLNNVRYGKQLMRKRDRVIAQLKQLSTLDEIEHFFNNNPVLHMAEHIITDPELWPYINYDYRLHISFSTMRKSDECSNTHHAPRGKVTNWSKKPDKPTGYPGWTGRISCVCNMFYNELLTTKGNKILRNKTRSSNSPSDVLRSFDILTGTGGGGYKKFGYDVRLFLDDFPGLYEQNIIDKISTE